MVMVNERIYTIVFVNQYRPRQLLCYFSINGNGEPS
jgi:hypothetical protein